MKRTKKENVAFWDGVSKTLGVLLMLACVIGVAWICCDAIKNRIDFKESLPCEFGVQEVDCYFACADSTTSIMKCDFYKITRECAYTCYDGVKLK